MLQKYSMWVISHWQLVMCGLSPISYAYLTCVAMWDKFFRQQADIVITLACMHWYMKKNYLIWVATTEIPIWSARVTDHRPVPFRSNIQTRINQRMLIISKVTNFPVTSKC